MLSGMADLFPEATLYPSMNDPDSELTAAAGSVVGEMKLGEGGTAGSVGAAIRTVEGEVFAGICIDLECGLGFCAEWPPLPGCWPTGRSASIP